MLLDWREAGVEPIDLYTVGMGLEQLLDCLVLLVESGKLATFACHPAVFNRFSAEDHHLEVVGQQSDAFECCRAQVENWLLTTGALLWISLEIAEHILKVDDYQWSVHQRHAPGEQFSFRELVDFVSRRQHQYFALLHQLVPRRLNLA